MNKFSIRHYHNAKIQAYSLSSVSSVVAQLHVFFAADSWLNVDDYIIKCLWRCYDFVFDIWCFDSG